MRHLIIRLIVEAIVGVAVAALLLAVAVPLLIRYHLLALGEARGVFLIGAVLVLAVGAILLRPGGSLRRLKY
jgi:hypothetical protein